MVVEPHTNSLSLGEVVTHIVIFIFQFYFYISNTLLK